MNALAASPVERLINDPLLLEVHADGGDVSVAELSVDHAVQEAGLAHAAVAQQQELEQVVVLHRHHSQE